MRLPLLFTLLLSTCVRAQESDTLLTADAPLTTVTAFGAKTARPASAAVAEIPVEEVRRYDQSSLLSALNRIPGVRFEERATASYRIAIRGASLRSPFGVRNTQVYWNGLPLAEPGGDVPLNFLDAGNVDRVDVLRGPSGGFYGPGTAGTLLLNTDFEEDRDKTLRAGGAVGSYDFLRGNVTINRRADNGDPHQLRLGGQWTQGYRDHSSMERLTAQYSAEFNGKTRLHALYTDLSYDLPGGLNAEQFADNPRQARPGSADKNASINYHNLLLGVTDQRRFGRLTLESTAYVSGFYFDHPFNIDYKRETNLAAGGRLALRRLLADDLDVVAGGEMKRQLRFGNNYTNPDGTRPGDLNFSDEIYSDELLLFGQLRYLPGAWDFTLGLSSAEVYYDVDRTFNAGGATGETEFVSTRPISVRLAAGRRLGERHHAYASRADGFSPPSLDEFRTNEGSLNSDLDPEIGTNYEVGYRYADERFTVTATVFHFRLTEAITSFADEEGRQLFRNAGRSTQNGLELSAQHEMRLTDRVDLRLFGTYTYYDFTYEELERDGTNFSGQTIPGAAPHTTNAEVVVNWDRKLEISVLHNFVDAIPLNDANDVSADSYHLVRAALSYRIGQVTAFVSGSNLLNERMSFGNDLNPRFGGRYFQPAPGANFQVGVRY